MIWMYFSTITPTADITMLALSRASWSQSLLNKSVIKKERKERKRTHGYGL
jgi:hypothetical protein